jgi:hypothetical protein
MVSDPDLLTEWRQRLISEADSVIRQSTAGCPERFRDAMLAAIEITRPLEISLLACGAARWSGGAFEAGLPAAVAAHLLRAALVSHATLPGFESSFASGAVPLCDRFDDSTAILAGDALIPLAVSHLVSNGGRHGTALVDDAMEAIGAQGVLAGISLEQEGRISTLTGDIEARELWAGSLARFAAVSGARLAGASERQMDQISLLGLESGRAWCMISSICTGGGDGGKWQELHRESLSIFDDARILAGTGEEGYLLREIIDCLKNRPPADPSDLFF